jgi:hypothetical protein
MNFDKSLRSALPPQIEPATLQMQIDKRIARFRAVRQVQRLTLSLTATCTAIAAFLLVPTLSAQAALARITGALDGVQTLVSRRYTIDEHGRRYLAGTQSYDHGRWRLEARGGKDITIYTQGRRYVYEGYTNSYIVEDSSGPFKHNGDIGLASQLRHMSAWNTDVVLDTSTFKGKKVRRAIVTSRDLPERYIILADLQTSLPLKAYVDAREGTGWRRGSEMDFDYSATPNPESFVPDPKLPTLTAEQWKQTVVKTMTRRTIERVPLRKGELIFRAFEVATDGTVFVAYQTREARGGWTGYPFTLTDDLGSEYAQLEMVNSSDDPFRGISRANGGPMEFAVFVPINVQPWVPRTLKLEAHIGNKGELVRMVPMTIWYADGRKVTEMRANWWGSDHSTSFSDKVILSRSVSDPTCFERPEFITIQTHGEWSDDLTSQLRKAETRARHFGDKPEAEYWLREQLRIISKIESAGGGPYARGRIQERLAKFERSRK